MGNARITMKVAKVDEALGLIIGFAIVCKKAGDDYYDLQGDHIPEDEMLKAATDFMLHSRAVKQMHAGAEHGDVVFAMPITGEIAKSLGMTTEQTGLVIGAKVDADTIAKYKRAELTEWSLGGEAVREAA